MGIPINRARFDELRKNHGIYTARDMAQREARAQHLIFLRRDIDSLYPTDPDFAVNLRDILRKIIDAIEED